MSAVCTRGLAGEATLVTLFAVYVGALMLTSAPWPSTPPHVMHLATQGVHYAKAPVYRDFRAGDVRHSQADIGKAQRLLGYAPLWDLRAGVAQAMPWYIAQP